MRKLHVYLAAALAAVMVLTPAQALAAGDVPKEEVVYAALTPEGALDTVDVVNIFDLAEAAQITDHGDYASVRSMTTTDQIDYDGGTAVIDAGPGRLYYEGRMTDPALPWLVSLTYELGGEEIAPADLAGQSGELAIHLTVEKDPDCPGTFFEDYGLQAVITLDTARCRNIDAPGATAANVGGDKQLTYTILPGAGADITVTADVTGFEMDGVALNGVLMAMDLSLDTEGMTEELTPLTGAVAELDTGASDLASGAADLASGAAELQTGLAGLNGQTAALTEGSAALLTGLQQLQAGLAGVTFTQEDADALTASAASLQTAAASLAEGLGTVGAMAESLTALQTGYTTAAGGLRTAIDAMNAAGLPSTEPLETVWQGLDACNGQFAQALAGLTGMGDTAAQLQTGMTELAASLGTLATELPGMVGALPQLTGSVDALVEAGTTLDAGIQAYAAGVTAVAEGFGLPEDPEAPESGEEKTTLMDGVTQLNDGAAALSEGATALAEGTEGLEDTVKEKIDGMLAAVSGDVDVTSFVSPENENVTAVQFVITAPAIRVPAPEEPEPTPAPERTFWQKLTDLF